MNTICIVILLSLNAIIIEIGFIYVLKYLDRKEERLAKEYYLSLNITDDKLNLLDKLIDIEFENYIKIHPDKFEITGNSYIKESEFHDIIVDITTRVHNRLSPIIIENIKMVYAVDNNDDIIRIIGEKVGLNLALAASEVNTALTDEVASVNINI